MRRCIDTANLVRAGRFLHSAALLGGLARATPRHNGTRAASYRPTCDLIVQGQTLRLCSILTPCTAATRLHSPALPGACLTPPRPAPLLPLHRPGSGPPERTPSGGRQGPPAPPARGREEPARDERPPRDAKPAEPEAEAPGSEGGEGMPDEQMRAKAKGLLAELYNTQDTQEALTCVK